jgi:hypothetical protein
MSKNFILVIKTKTITIKKITIKIIIKINLKIKIRNLMKKGLNLMMYL